MEAQQAKIRAWAELNNAETVEIFTDAGISGKRSDNRPALQAALNATRKGDALVVYSLSRLARSTKDTIQIAEKLDKQGADLVSMSEKIDTTTAAGKMVFRMLAVLSEFERDQISERTRNALAYKKANGEKTGGDTPYGFTVNDYGHLAPHPQEQEAIALIRDLRTKGHTFRAIAQELEAKGYTTKQGRTQWNPKTVRAITERETIAA